MGFKKSRIFSAFKKQNKKKQLTKSVKNGKKGFGFLHMAHVTILFGFHHCKDKQVQVVGFFMFFVV